MLGYPQPHYQQGYSPAIARQEMFLSQVIRPSDLTHIKTSSEVIFALTLKSFSVQHMMYSLTYLMYDDNDACTIMAFY